MNPLSGCTVTPATCHVTRAALDKALVDAADGANVIAFNDAFIPGSDPPLCRVCSGLVGEHSGGARVRDQDTPAAFVSVPNGVDIYEELPWAHSQTLALALIAVGAAVAIALYFFLRLTLLVAVVFFAAACAVAYRARTFTVTCDRNTGTVRMTEKRLLPGSCLVRQPLDFSVHSMGHPTLGDGASGSGPHDVFVEYGGLQHRIGTVADEAELLVWHMYFVRLRASTQPPASGVVRVEVGPSAGPPPQPYPQHTPYPVAQPPPPPVEERHHQPQPQPGGYAPVGANQHQQQQR